MLNTLRSLALGQPILPEIAPITGPMYQLFIFFMITDPRTVVRGRRPQIDRRRHHRARRSADPVRVRSGLAAAHRVQRGAGACRAVARGPGGEVDRPPPRRSAKTGSGAIPRSAGSASTS